MPQPFKDRFVHERGIALILFTLALPVLLGLTILAVDLGNLYLTRDKLNLLNRSAAATALNVRALRGWAPLACAGVADQARGYKCSDAVGLSAPQGEQYKELVKEVKKTLVTQIKNLFPDSVTTTGSIDNTNDLVQYGLPNSAGTATVWTTTAPAETADIYNLKTDTFRLKVRYGVKTLLLSKLAALLKVPITSLCAQAGQSQDNRCWVESSDTLSNSATTKARIIMLLDTSGSMQNIPAGASQSKQEALKSAASSFIDYFNPTKDEIGIIPFGTAVKIGGRSRLTFEEAGGNGFLKIKDTISDLTVSGQTNPCDALIESMSMLPSNSSSEPPTRTFVVLFTDGAPNVYRLQFCDPATSVNGCVHPASLQAISPTKNDWYGWTVKWGRRETYCPEGSVCPSGSNFSGSEQSSNNNPFYGAPKIKGADGTFSFNTTKNEKFRINEKGEFMIRGPDTTSGTFGPWCNMELPRNDCIGALNTPAYNNLPYSRVFKSLSPTTGEDNYLWNGPSYLVNRPDQATGFLFSQVKNLIDRVNTDSANVFKTCGIPKSSISPSPATDHDQYNYNHSLYFASRVLDKNWNLDRELFGTGTSFQQKALVFLRTSSSLNAIVNRPALGFFDPPSQPYNVSFYKGGGTGNVPNTTFTPGGSVGCLEALDAEIPGTGAKLFVGAGQASFWSNTTPESIGLVGEIIKSAELPYYCAIRTADYLRQAKNVTVFAVGLGNGAQYTYGATCDDPMQNALDFDSRKDYFLQRLAFAPEAIRFNTATSDLSAATWQPQADFELKKRDLTGCYSTHPLNNHTVYLGFSQNCTTNRSAPTNLATTPTGECQNPLGPSTPGGSASNHTVPRDFTRDAIGGYYPTSEPTALKAQFGAIAKQILFRLTL